MSLRAWARVSVMSHRRVEELMDGGEALSEVLPAGLHWVATTELGAHRGLGVHLRPHRLLSGHELGRRGESGGRSWHGAARRTRGWWSRNLRARGARFLPRWVGRERRSSRPSLRGVHPADDALGVAGDARVIALRLLPLRVGRVGEE